MMDLEEFLDALSTYLKAQIPAEVTAMNAKKGDTLLKNFNTNAVFIQTLDDRVANYEQFVFIQAASGSVNSAVRSSVVYTHAIGVYMLFGDIGLDEKARPLLFRWNEILRNILVKGFDRISPGLKMIVADLDPMAYVKINESRMLLATGITMEVTFGK